MKKLIPLILLLGYGSVQAAVVTWTVNGTFVDGGTMTGTFDYDADSNMYSNISITTTNYAPACCGAQFGGTYTTPFTFGSLDESHFFAETNASVGGNFLILQLDFLSDLTNAGGVVNIDVNSNNSIEIVTSFEAIRNLMPGATVSAVPIPAAVWLFGSALAGLGWLRRKQDV